MKKGTSVRKIKRIPIITHKILILRKSWSSLKSISCDCRQSWENGLFSKINKTPIIKNIIWLVCRLLIPHNSNPIIRLKFGRLWDAFVGSYLGLWYLMIILTAPPNTTTIVNQRIIGIIGVFGWQLPRILTVNIAARKININTTISFDRLLIALY